MSVGESQLGSAGNVRTKYLAKPLSSVSLAFRNAVYTIPTALERIRGSAGYQTVAVRGTDGLLCYMKDKDYLFQLRAEEGVCGDNEVSMGNLHRFSARVTLDEELEIYPVPRKAITPLTVLELVISPVSPADDKKVAIEYDHFLNSFLEAYNGCPFKSGIQFPMLYESPVGNIRLKVLVQEVFFKDHVAADSMAKLFPNHGYIDLSVQRPELLVTRDASCVNLQIAGAPSANKKKKVFKNDFDFQKLGIGGLDEQFNKLFYRAFASRMLPPDIFKKTGQKHVRGILLYGPPGCGKTLIARKMGEALHAHPPKIVNGPEILNKYVGQSEENIRALFADAEKEYREKGDDSDLHIIILDEMDAITKQRGSTGGGTGVNDSIVNQFLSKIDGVDALNNILIIGMTNRKDMIDSAILRPGRLEVHIEIGLPDQYGRVQIFTIHTRSLKKNNMLGSDVNLEVLADMTKNFTGAEIEGLVAAAVSEATKGFIAPDSDTTKVDFSNMKVTMEHFENALLEITPQFGVPETALSSCIRYGFTQFNDEYSKLYHSLEGLVEKMDTSVSGLFPILIQGAVASGKSALVAKFALDSKISCVRYVTAQDVTEKSEDARMRHLTDVFNEAYKATRALVILDDLDMIINYDVAGRSYSSTMLQYIKVRLKVNPPPNHKLIILATTSNGQAFENLRLRDSFRITHTLPLVVTKDEYLTVLRDCVTVIRKGDCEKVATIMHGKPLPINKLLSIVDITPIDADSYVVVDELLNSLEAESAYMFPPKKSVDFPEMEI